MTAATPSTVTTFRTTVARPRPEPTARSAGPRPVTGSAVHAVDAGAPPVA